MAIDPAVDKVLKEIRTTLESTWKGTVAEDLRPWMNFKGVKEVGKFDFEGLFGNGESGGLFDRRKLNDDYLKVRQQEKPKSKDIWIPKISSDLVAGFQRDYVMRTRSRVRMLMHAAVRQKSDSVAEGPFTANTITLMARLDTAQEAE